MKKIGFDIVEIARFRKHVKNPDDAFIRKAFTTAEVSYCTAYADAAQHYAGMFAAKEAVSKALGVARYPWAEIEIRHAKDGRPLAYRNGTKLPVSVSISHTADTAGAIALG